MKTAKKLLPKKIVIDRSKPFNPSKFFGKKRWRILEQDDRALEISEIDPAKILLAIMLEMNEELITVEENISRLKKKKYILLDAKVFQTFWENKELIRKKWKRMRVNNYNISIFFNGTILKNPEGEKCVLFLSINNGNLDFSYRYLYRYVRADNLSAVVK